MKWLWRAVAALLLTLGTIAAAPAAARADGEDWRINNYWITAEVDDHGTTSVDLSIDFDFGDEPGHGPYLTFPLRQEIGDDPDHWRMLDMTIGEVTSPTGANTETQVREEGGNLLIRVGSERQEFTGEQTYQLHYTIRGLIAPRQAQSGLDEFNWNAVGPDWEVPIRNAQVEVTGPAEVSKMACFQGRSFTDTCIAAQSGSTVTFTAEGIGEGSGMQVVAGFPAGTFTGAEARLERRLTVGNMFPVTPWTAGVAGILSVLGLAAVFRRTRRSARDQVYLGLTPGVLPTAGQEASVGYATDKAPVAVQFQPPAGARPGELGTLVDATADDADITATIIDLAVRGHLRISQTGRKDWTFTQLAGGDQLADYESDLLRRMFVAGSEVTTDDLRDSAYAELLTKTRSALHHRVAADLKWFTRNPATVRGVAIAIGIAIIAVGAGLGFLLGFVGWGLVGVAGVIVGLAVILLNNHFGARTPTGSAMLAQTKGFELYLRTAEAEQIKFEEGIDVFSRYLPYAIMFGVAERWTRIFTELAAQGRYEFNTYWYVGYGFGFNYHSFASSMDSLAHTMSSSMQHATAATSGGSGFSGGGGFGGGGGGGW